MARKVGDLFASLSLKDKEFLVRLGKAVDQSNRSGKQIQKSFDKINVKKATSGIKALFDAINLNKYSMGIAAAAASYYAILKPIGSFIKASQEAEAAENKLASAYKNTGIYSESLMKQTTNLAGEIQKLTVIDDDSIKANIALMQNIGRLSEDAIPKATKAAIGLSRIMNTDVQTAFMLVGRAAAGNTDLFTRYGITLDKSMNDNQKFNEILKRGIEGFEIAKSEINTSIGATQQLSNAFGDLKENLGGLISAGLDPLIERLKTIITNINENKVVWDKLKEWTSWRYGGAGVGSMFEGGTMGLGEAGAIAKGKSMLIPAHGMAKANVQYKKSVSSLPTRFKPMSPTISGGGQWAAQKYATITDEQRIASLQPEWYEQYLKDLRLRQKLALKEMTVDIRDESTNWQLAVKDFATSTRDVLADTLFDWFRGEIRGMGDLWRAFASSIGRAAFRGVANYITGGVEGLVARGMGGSSPVAKAAPVIERSGSGSSIIITGNQFTDVNQLTMLMKNVALNAVHEDYKNNGMVRQMVTR